MRTINMAADVSRQPPRVRMGGEVVAALIRAAAADDHAAWDRLVEEFSSMLWAIARAHRLRNADAADVVQATWLRLLEHLDEINEPARVGAWLATTARRECLRVIRRAKRDVLFAVEPVSNDVAPDDALLLAERDQCLWQCFSRLRPSDQALLRLLLLADPRPAYEEISAVLGMPVGSIGPKRARALTRLRRELQGESGLPLVVHS